MKLVTSAPPPLAFSDRTCAAVWGVPWRSMRSWLREHGIAIVHVGRRPIVRVADVLAVLERKTRPQWSEAEVVQLAAREAKVRDAAPSKLPRGEHVHGGG